ncbi:Cytochrome c oxidase biogenesis [Cordyceps militaris]|uniref:COX assembly mitochondrial protein n=1 Tax=Cordyceps militaris TaxID=73501 RepID=A0A2H4SIG5_CORMI|nr:Cytochrome c oxidase biogenesis [Cordyceps militaris]
MAGQASDLPMPPPSVWASLHGIRFRCPPPKSPKCATFTTRASASNAPTRSKTCFSSAFAACALGRTFTVSFACRAEHRAMNGCMKLHANQAEHDAAREEWFAMRMDRQRQREAKNKVAVAQEEFMHDWWGLPEDVRLSRQREAEKNGSKLQERIGGMPAKDRPLDGSRR